MQNVYEDYVPSPPVSQAVLDAIREKYFDIPYCEQSESQKLDLYLPNERIRGRCPVIMYYHGGAFARRTKRDQSVEPALRALGRGYAVVSVEYRKSKEARFPAMVYDAKAAVRWVRANAEQYGLDSERIAAWGPSSGGWLAAYLAVTNDNPAFENPEQGNAEFSSRVQACVDWCGPCGGFLEMDRQVRESGIGTANHSDADSPESLFLGTQVTRIPELARLASPISHVRRDTVPVCIVHGGDDAVVPVGQSEDFYAALKRCSCRAMLHVEPGRPHHGDPWYLEEWVSRMCLDFLDEVL